MCGIVGIVSRNPQHSGLLVRMSELVKHRGPDDEGYYLSLEGREEFLKGNDTIPELSALGSIHDREHPSTIGLAHRRLSILDLSSNGHQPMPYDGRVVIILNGEIYNFLELKAELQKLSFRFQSGSDTEVVAAAYCQWGPDCVKRFIGMWAFALYDKKNNLLFCSRDRFGIKPLYYSKTSDGLVFGSEVKVFFEHPGVLPVADLSKSIEYVTTGRLNFGDQTLFSGISVLPPAHNMLFDLETHALTLHQYYAPGEDQRRHIASNGESVAAFSELFTDAVRLHLRSDVPVGSCLSGGLDSSLLFSLMSGQSLPYPLNSFTASFPGNEIDEISYVMKLKQGIEFNQFIAVPDAGGFWKDVDSLVWHQDLPMNTSSPYAQWEVMKLARSENVKVLLDGQGSDEILGGYSEFVGAFLLHYLLQFRLAGFIRNFRHLQDNYNSSRLLNTLLRAGFHYAPRGLQHFFYERMRIAPSFINKDYRELAEGIPFFKRISSSMRETSLYSLDQSLGTLLRYEDRNSMAFSIESRVPYLDHRIVDFCLNLPDESKIHRGWTKYILRKAGEHRLPHEVVWRKRKLGFVTPESKWQSELRAELAEFVSSTVPPDFINKNKVLSSLNVHMPDPINTGELWRMVLFLKWVEVFKVGFGR
jgi:asparagine synthase (glutamine-hydrolysing)